MKKTVDNLTQIYKVQLEESKLPQSNEFIAQVEESVNSREQSNSQKFSSYLQQELVTSSNSSDSTSIQRPLDLITPQQALSNDFFDLPMSDTSANSSLISMVSTTEVDENFCSEKFSSDFKLKIVLNKRQLASVEDATTKELETFLESAVCQLPPVNPVTANRFVDCLQDLFHPFNLEMCMSAAFGIFPAFITHEMLMRLTSGDLFIQFKNLKLFVTFFKPYLLKVTNVIVWSQFNFVGVNSVHTTIISCLNNACHSLSKVSLTPFFSSQLLESIASRRSVIQGHLLALKAKPFFNKVVLIRVFTITLGAIVLPLVVPIVRRFVSDQLFLLFSKEKLAELATKVVTVIVTKEHVTQVLDKVLESVRDHPSNPLIIIEGIPSTLINIVHGLVKNYTLENFDGRLNVAVDILATFFN